MTAMGDGWDPRGGSGGASGQMKPMNSGPSGQKPLGMAGQQRQNVQTSRGEQGGNAYPTRPAPPNPNTMEKADIMVIRLVSGMIAEEVGILCFAEGSGTWPPIQSSWRDHENGGAPGFSKLGFV